MTWSHKILLVDNGRILGTGISNTPLLRGVDCGFCHVVLEVWLLGLEKLVALFGDEWTRDVW